MYYAVLNNRCLLECKWTVFKNSHPVISCPTDNPPFKSDLRAISLGMNIYSVSLLSCRKRLGSRHGTGGPSQPASAAVWFRWNAALLYHGTVSTCEIDTLFWQLCSSVEFWVHDETSYVRGRGRESFLTKRGSWGENTRIFRTWQRGRLFQAVGLGQLFWLTLRIEMFFDLRPEVLERALSS